MLSDVEYLRYGRQLMLAEVGEEGQAPAAEDEAPKAETSEPRDTKAPEANAEGAAS